MARVCKNTKLKNNYLDQIDERNKLEKVQFRDIFTEYMELMNDNALLSQKNQNLDKDNYNLR